MHVNECGRSASKQAIETRLAPYARTPIRLRRPQRSMAE
uniref:Uncharacterized protein n=1 Tax=uncultured bacterium A1Q1_fos_600 TaxID=1256587 RepID=L7VVS6_9BACT|nr:hypothetical protein [uncultured bacterium A1Q1_fos_600]